MDVQKTMVLNEQGLYHTTQLWHVPLWHTPLFYYLSIVGIGLVCVAVTWLVVYAIRRAQRTRITPVQWALQELALIKTKNLMHPQASKQFYGQMHTIIKVFLQKTYLVPFTSYTDHELIDYLSRYALPHIDNGTVSHVKRIVSEAMAIKFHVKQVTLECMEKDFDDVLSFIRMHRTS